MFAIFKEKNSRQHKTSYIIIYKLQNHNKLVICVLSNLKSNFWCAKDIDIPIKWL